MHMEEGAVVAFINRVYEVWAWRALLEALAASCSRQDSGARRRTIPCDLLLHTTKYSYLWHKQDKSGLLAPRDADAQKSIICTSPLISSTP